jgi:NAD(P)-dependent dehydrogenase (short-subunit alcohol dehydrogenase family)
VPASNRKRAVVTGGSSGIGRIDVPINNAGENRGRPFLEDRSRNRRQDHQRHVRPRGYPLQQGIAYCASKGGLGLATRVMALELASYGIAVNAVAPGHTAAPMNVDTDTKALDVESPMIPLGSPGDPAEAAEAVTFLADRANYVTGSSYLVDGGSLLVAGPQLLEELCDVTAPEAS